MGMNKIWYSFIGNIDKKSTFFHDQEVSLKKLCSVLCLDIITLTFLQIGLKVSLLVAMHSQNVYQS